MGVRDSDLEKQSGIPGAIFVHINGWIGGAKTKEGALEMAIKTIEQSQYKGENKNLIKSEEIG